MKTKYVWALGLWWLGVCQAGLGPEAVSAHPLYIGESGPDVRTLVLANLPRMQAKRGRTQETGATTRWPSAVGGE